MLSGGEKYTIKLKGTKCYLKNTGLKSINFTTDIEKAKVFEYNGKADLIDKLNYGELSARGGHGQHKSKIDHIRLTMDKATWQNLYGEHPDQIRNISDSRLRCHRFNFTLSDQFEIKAESYSKTGEFPNLECEYYGEDFERENLLKK